MKNSIRLIVIFLSLAIAGHAQMTQPSTQTPPPQAAPMHAQMDTTKMPDASNTMPDGYVLKGGKVEQVKAGVLTPISQNMKLANGTWVMPDGTLKDVNNKTSKLQEGQEVEMDGKLITPSTSAIPHN
jgi:hypothetical protein